MEVEVEVGKQLPAEGRRQLEEGITIVFARWFTLKTAVREEWGRPESYTKLFSKVLNFFTQSPPRNKDQYDLEDLLFYFMVDNFAVSPAPDNDAFEIEIQQVGADLMTVYEGCLQGDYESIQQLKAKLLKEQPLHDSYIPQTATSSDDDDVDENQGNPSDSSMKPCSSSSLTTHEAEDGWVSVTSKKRNSKGRKM